MLNRREFLRLAGRTAGVVCLVQQAPRWLVRSAEAAPQDRTLLTVFLRGGCDGLNCVVPYGDDNYHVMRPSLRIPAPGSGGANPALNLNGFFGLHPMLRGLSAMYSQGRVAVLPAVHYRDAPRSHFQSQAALEQAGAGDSSGWLNRYLAVLGSSASLPGVALAPNAPAAIKGRLQVRTLNSLKASGLSGDAGEETQLMTALGPHYRGRSAVADSSTMAAVREAGLMALQDVNFLRSLRAGEYRVTGGARYPETDFGIHLRDAALLIKAEVGLKAATIDLGGWDTHVGQGNGAPDGRQSRAFAELDAGLQAFITDLGPRANQVAVLVMTEFGRTADQNASGGTDHGNASAWFVLGGAVRGGIYLGSRGWPGLARDRLREERDLVHTLEYRDVMAELLTRHLALPAAALATVLPGAGTKPIGFL